MSLRPRYSLLTLLVLTALVAGGAKLWRGPHHVVERIEPFKEFEYTYTRDWQGKKVLHGFCICRSIDPNLLKNSFILILCYRQGVQVNWCCNYNLVPNDLDPPMILIGDEWVTIEDNKDTTETLLTRAEFEEYQKTIEQQKQHLLLLGYKQQLFEHSWDGPADIEEIKERLGVPFSFE